MKSIDVMMVRVYIMESSHLLDKILNYLKSEINVRGVSVFRAIKGFGSAGTHASEFLTLSLDLPLAIEFFDTKDKIEPALEHLNEMVKPEHMVFWDAKVWVKT